MAAITASMVKELREMSGAGMMDCKKALTETDGDFDKAVEFLREKGLATAVKKAGRIAAEGIVMTTVVDGGKKAAMVEVNAETDFVAKNEVFQTYVKEVVDQIVSTDVQDVEALKNEKWALDPSMTVAEKHAAMVAKIGENMNIRRFAKISTDGHIVSYIHAGGKIGVLVEADTDASGEAIDECMKNIAMQVAAMNPQYISRNDISAEDLAKLREITVDSALNDATTLPKPILNKLIDKAINEKLWSDDDINNFNEHKNNMNYVWNFLSDAAKAKLGELAMADKESIVAEKMFNGLVEGRVSKQLKEICLLDQTYVKAEDGKQSVAKYLAEVAKANGAFTVKEYVRFETGEGLEKKNEDFAAEVAAQLQ